MIQMFVDDGAARAQLGLAALEREPEGADLPALVGGDVFADTNAAGGGHRAGVDDVDHLLRAALQHAGDGGIAQQRRLPLPRRALVTDANLLQVGVGFQHLRQQRRHAPRQVEVGIQLLIFDLGERGYVDGVLHHAVF